MRAQKHVIPDTQHTLTLTYTPSDPLRSAQVSVHTGAANPTCPYNTDIQKCKTLSEKTVAVAERSPHLCLSHSAFIYIFTFFLE